MAHPKLPAYMERIRAHLLAERGMSEAKATSTSIATCHVFCESGKSPNLPHTVVNPASRAEACTAVEQLKAMRKPKQPEPVQEPPSRPVQPEPKPEPQKEPPVAERIAEGPWNGDASRFSDQEYQRACALDRGGDGPVKERFGLPIREPDGRLSRAGVHAAAQRIGSVTGAPAEAIRAAAKALVAAYKQLGEEPPENVLKLACLTAAAGAVAAASQHEQRDLEEVVEVRSAPDSISLDPTGKRLRGRIPYDVESRNLGGFTEIMRPGCLRDADLSDLVATVDHAGLPLGRYPNTLTLEHCDDCAYWEVPLPESRADVREAVQRGDLNQSSWRMVVKRDSWQGSTRFVEEVRSLRDVSLVTTSAYPATATAVELRARPETKEEPTMPLEVEHGQEEQPVEEETRTVEAAGGLRVEERSLTPDAGTDVETRILDAMRGVPTGEARDLTTADISAGPVEPPQLSTYLWDRLRDQAVVLATGIRVITTSNKSIKWPRLVSDTTADFYDELEEIDESDPGFDEWEIDPKAIKALVRGSSEAFDDSSPDLLTIVRQNLETILALKLDRELLIGNAAKGFKGLTNTTGIATMDAAGTATNYDALVKATGVLAGNHVPGPYAAITHPWVETHFGLLKTTIGETLQRPAGVPAFATTTQIGHDDGDGTSSILVYAPQKVAVVRRMDVEILVDRSQEFTKDAVLVRGKIRATLFCPYPEAVVRIDNVPAPDPSA